MFKCQYNIEHLCDVSHEYGHISETMSIMNYYMYFFLLTSCPDFIILPVLKKCVHKKVFKKVIKMPLKNVTPLFATNRTLVCNIRTYVLL